MLPSVYRVAGAPDSWHQRLMAARLWAPDAAISHRAAAALWEFDGFDRGPVELSTVGPRTSYEAWITLHRTQKLEGEDIGRLGPFAITTPARTLADLCAEGRDVVEPALDDAIRRGLTTLPRLQWTAGRLGGKGGRELDSWASCSANEEVDGHHRQASSRRAWRSS